jgi:hypothetical protein
MRPSSVSKNILVGSVRRTSVTVLIVKSDSKFLRSLTVLMCMDCVLHVQAVQSAMHCTLCMVQLATHHTSIPLNH